MASEKTIIAALHLVGLTQLSGVEVRRDSAFDFFNLADVQSADRLMSRETRRNWSRLNNSGKNKLTSRANKRRSNKRILPLEYMVNTNNIGFVQDALRVIDDSGCSIFDAIYTLGTRLLARSGIMTKEHVQKALEEYSELKTVPELAAIEIPGDEFDVLGLVYQSYMSEGEKNQKGSYYTPLKIARNMTRSFSLANGETVFDPCCGSGAFLLSASAPAPFQLWGCDIDPVAVFIAKVNLLVKYPTFEFAPQIKCIDYLESCEHLDLFDVQRFDYIVTNPPWGAMKRKVTFDADMMSDETFSCFFIKAFGQLKDTGSIRFLFPESILNVKVHKDIREFILRKAGLKGITRYDDGFSGVYTKYVDFDCGYGADTNQFTLTTSRGARTIPISTVYQTRNIVFNFLSETDVRIISAVKKIGKYNLSESVWGLGIVTGDNKNKLFDAHSSGLESIYTGKEVQPYTLKPARCFVKYNREEFQQAAKDEIYRAPEKLIYKFISDKLTFSYDNGGGLCLNSANVLIPKVPQMSVKTVMAFLNSRLFQYLHMRMFGESKILKGNLQELPFPEISEEQNSVLSDFVDGILNGDSSKMNDVDDFIFKLYGLSDDEERYIREVVNGTIAK